ncbi:MarR family winged helix-turn-helix transcriptional regulator [Lysinimonas soli]|uniref:MarR family winged helix-turn-helix transcriptional regulator n=1 Tax=Lysinimonas soli TaxID=1074233 RepID=A0ABW0NRN3_9MICO
MFAMVADDELSEADGGLSDADWSVWRDVMAMTSQLARELDRRLQSDAGISHADYSVLLVLQRAPEHQLRTGELAELLAWEKSRVSHQVARMEARGLLERAECPTDGRGTWVSPTDAGRRTLLAAARNHTATIRELFFDALGDDQRLAMGDAAVRVLDRLSPAACELADEKGMMSRTRVRASA